MAPFQTSYDTNTSVTSMSINSLITGVTVSPTSSTGSYARYQKIGSIVNIEFKYIFATLPTGAMSINLPIPISTNYPKPQSIFHIRYITTPGTYYGYYNEKDVNSINLVTQLTFGAAASAFTGISPNTLVVGDILTGVIIYEK